MNKLLRGALHIGVVAGFAFAGGFAAQLAFHTASGQAQVVPEDVYKSADNSVSRVQQQPQVEVPSNLAQNILTLTDSKNRKGISTFVNNGQPSQIMYGEDGQMRIQIGTYSSAIERGMPLIALSDNTGHVRLLFRLAGDNQSPVMIMKDNMGKDRLIMGLNLTGPTQEPFLETVDKDGKHTSVFGSYK